MVQRRKKRDQRPDAWARAGEKDRNGEGLEGVRGKEDPGWKKSVKKSLTVPEGLTILQRRLDESGDAAGATGSGPVERRRLAKKTS